jgi:hypothetical protein
MGVLRRFKSSATESGSPSFLVHTKTKHGVSHVVLRKGRKGTNMTAPKLGANPNHARTEGANGRQFDAPKQRHALWTFGWEKIEVSCR